MVKVLYGSDAIQVLDSSLTFLRLGFSSWSSWYGGEFHGFLFLFDPRRRRQLIDLVSVFSLSLSRMGEPFLCICICVYSFLLFLF